MDSKRRGEGRGLGALGLALALAAGACAGPSAAGRQALSGPAGRLYACARTGLMELGYQVVRGDDAEGLLVAERRTRGWPGETSRSEAVFDVLSARVSVQEEDGPALLRVTPLTVSREGSASRLSAVERPLLTSQRVRQDADRLTARCGGGA